MDFWAFINVFNEIAPGGSLILLVYLVLEVRHINQKLDNHITDTNKKIDKLSDRMDRQGDRFDRLYEFLIQDKKDKE